jgi:hypothetical protein
VDSLYCSKLSCLLIDSSNIHISYFSSLQHWRLKVISRKSVSPKHLIDLIATILVSFRRKISDNSWGRTLLPSKSTTSLAKVTPTATENVSSASSAFLLLYEIPHACTLAPPVTYQEFLTMFRKKTVALKKTVVHMESSITDAGVDEDLLGLDANIPGGRFDSSIDPKLKNPPPTL